MLILLAIEWLLLKARYYRESKVGLAEFVLRTRRLPLNTFGALTHYGISLLLFCIATFLTILCFRDVISEVVSQEISPLIVRFILVLTVIGIISWRNVRHVEEAIRNKESEWNRKAKNVR